MKQLSFSLILFFGLAAIPSFADPKFVTVDDTRANDICSNTTWINWWSCRDEIKGFRLQEDVLSDVLRAQRSGPIEFRSVLIAMNNKSFEIESFQAAESLISPNYFLQLIQVMANGHFDNHLILYCDSHSRFHPILTSRGLNQDKIIDCLQTIKDVSWSEALDLKLIGCKLGPFDHRVLCMKTVLKKN
jgi:hypothetical protein